MSHLDLNRTFQNLRVEIATANHNWGTSETNVDPSRGLEVVDSFINAPIAAEQLHITRHLSRICIGCRLYSFHFHHPIEVLLGLGDMRL